MLPSLLLVASFVLLCANGIGACCMPKLYQAHLVDTNSANLRVQSYIQDFTKMKYLLKPVADNETYTNIDAILGDNSQDITYTFYKDGSCTIKQTSEEEKSKYHHYRCLSKEYDSAGSSIIGETTGDAYILNKTDESEAFLLVSRNRCYPMVRIYRNKETSESSVVLIANVRVKIDGSELDRDVSTCVYTDDIIG